MKKIAAFIFVSILIHNAKAQAGLSFNLNNDSTLIALKNTVMSIYKEYNVNDDNYKNKLPETVVNKIEDVFLSITRREEIILTEYFLENAEFIYHHVNDKLLLSDSFDLRLNKLKFEIIDNFGSNSNRYPSQLTNSINKINDLLERRTMLLQNQKLSPYEVKEDSLIESKKIELIGVPKFGFGISSNQIFFSGQYAFVLGQYKSAYFGIGSGIEYVNRAEGLVSLIQAPVYVANYFYFDRMMYINFDYGLCIPMSASYKNYKDVVVDYKDSELKNTFYLDLGIGIQKYKTGFQLNFRNQSLGIPDDLNQRVWMFGFKIKF